MTIFLTKAEESGTLQLRGGGHPSQKTERADHKGATPIEKNVHVIDEEGRTYAPTYPRRAKGLVKNGRARWVDEETICLCRPPDFDDTEDRNMDTNSVNETMEHTETVYTDTREVTAVDLLDRMERLLANTEYITQIIDAVQTTPVNDSPEGGRDGFARGQVLQKLAEGYADNVHYALAIIERMYKGICPEAYLTPDEQIRLQWENPGSMKEHDDIPASVKADAIAQVLRGVDTVGMDANAISALFEEINKLF